MPQPSWSPENSRSSAMALRRSSSPRLPDQRPTGAAGDAFAMPVGLRRAVNLRAGGDHQFAGVIDVLGDRPMMGVWIEAESTVTTVSQGMSRPKGA